MTKKIIARLQDESFATIFNNGNSDFSNIESKYQIPEFPTEKIFPFDPEKKLESDEWFYVEPDEERKNELISPYISTLTNIDSVNPIAQEDYQDIRAICLVEDGETEKIILTRVFPRFYTMSKTIFKWDDGPKLETQSSSVDFTANIDAYWANGKLYFKSYSHIKPVFDGLENFYRTATEEERNDFLGKDYFSCPNTGIEIGHRNLRKIASVINSINWSDSETRQKYINYANQYPNIGVQIDDGKMKIESNQDVTKILTVLEERIYTTPITGENREANSVTKLSNA